MSQRVLHDKTGSAEEFVLEADAENLWFGSVTSPNRNDVIPNKVFSGFYLVVSKLFLF